MSADRPAAPETRLVTGADGLRRFFAGLVEQVFQTDLGVADPSLTDYLSDLLVRFLPAGPPAGGLTGALIEADRTEGEPRRESYRLAGDVALFWTGVYPARLRARGTADALLDVPAVGKAAYRAAAGTPEEPRPVLLRLADQFDLCGDGLARVRAEWSG